MNIDEALNATSLLYSVEKLLPKFLSKFLLIIIIIINTYNKKMPFTTILVNRNAQIIVLPMQMRQFCHRRYFPDGPYIHVTHARVCKIKEYRPRGPTLSNCLASLEPLTLQFLRLLYVLQICSLLRGGIAERGGVRVGHRIIEINSQSVVAVAHDKIVNMLATSVGEVRWGHSCLLVYKTETYCQTFYMGVGSNLILGGGKCSGMLTRGSGGILPSGNF